MKLFKTATLAAVALAGLTLSANAASFSLSLTNGTATTLPNPAYSLATPTLPHAIIDFTDPGPGSFGGLLVDDGTMIKATYIGSEAGATNTVDFGFGAATFSNQTSNAGDMVTFTSTGSFVDMFFSTDNLGGNDTINNNSGQATNPALHLAFSDITNAVGDVTSIFAFFGDGAGDQDFDDLVVRLDIVTPVPLPAALPLMGAGMGILGLFGWRRRQKTAALA